MHRVPCYRREMDDRQRGLSSHWQGHFADASWADKQLDAKQGLGTFSRWAPHRALLHFMLQRSLLRLGRGYRHFPETLAAGRRTAAAHGRVFDMDHLRQVLSVACVREYVDLAPDRPHVITVIGDGYARLASLLLATLPQSRIVLVNLPPALAIDLAAVRRAFPRAPLIEPGNESRNPAELPPGSVMGIVAADSNTLSQIPIDGAFNVSSMQEMDLTTIRGYFQVLRSSPAPATWFYCANAIEKKWSDGTVIRFAEYPWHAQDRVLVDELCPWAHLAYTTFPPRHVVRPFRNQHRLAWLHKPRP